MKNEVLKTIKENNMFDFGDKVIVAVSGGSDSICLLHMLNKLKADLNINLSVVHVNHCLRGAEADLDEIYVKEFSNKLNIPFYSKAFDVNKISEEKGVSSEMAGRLVRYEYFSEIKNALGANKIAIAHNANDQAETILMRIMRGTGSEGLIGIDAVRDNIYVRPLINVTRKEIDEYCEKNNLKPRIDKTNLENIYSRNKVRLELLPYIAENFNKDIVNALIRLGENLKVDNEYVNKVVEKKFITLCKTEKEKVIIKKEAFNEEPAIIRRLIRKALSELLGSTYNFERKHILDIIELQKQSSGLQISMPKNIVVYNNYKDIIIKFKEIKVFSDNSENTLSLNKENFLYEKDLIVDVEVLDCKQNIKFSEDSYTKYFDYDKINGNIKVRFRREGDKFKITNNNKEGKKLKDIFINLKINKQLRDKIPLICFNDEIAWIVGYKISNRFKIDCDTKKILKIKVRRAK